MAHQSNQFYKLLLLHRHGIVPQTLQPAKLDTPYLTPVLSHPELFPPRETSGRTATVT